MNSMLRDSGSSMALQAAQAEANWTLALHTPQQRLNATFVEEDLTAKSLLGALCSSLQRTASALKGREGSCVLLTHILRGHALS
jgi:hypothetical protein